MLAMAVEINREDMWEAMKHTIQEKNMLFLLQVLVQTEVGVEMAFHLVAEQPLLDGPMSTTGLHRVIVGDL
jgi:hypothetical protein